MKKFKNYISVFFNGSQSGIETIEFIGLVVVAAVLIAVVAGIGTSFSDQASTAQDQMNKSLDSLNQLLKDE